MAEIDRFLKVHCERLRQTILDKVQVTQMQIVSAVEDKVLDKLEQSRREVTGRAFMSSWAWDSAFVLSELMVIQG